MSNKTTKAATILLIILALTELGVILLMKAPGAKTEPVESQEKALLVQTIKVKPSETPDTVYLPAKILANVSATLAAEKPGRILKLEADRGDRVEKGQLLLQTDDRIWKAALERAEVAMRDTRNNYERFRKLKETGAVSASEYEGLERQYLVAKAAQDEASVNIEQCRITAPVSGIINNRFVEEGEYVQPGTPVFELVDARTVKVHILIPEKDIFAIHLGDRIRFTVRPHGEEVFTGTVSFIAMQADERNNAFRTELTVDNGNGRLRPGMIARVEFIRGIQKNMVSLPLSAIVPSKGDHIVYLAINDQAVRRKVEIENITRERALISGGLTEGDLVITAGNRALSDGQRVELEGDGARQ